MLGWCRTEEISKLSNLSTLLGNGWLNVPELTWFLVMTTCKVNNCVIYGSLILFSLCKGWELESYEYS